MGWDALPPILLVYDQQFLPGISGLVASRLVDEFHRPAVVMTQVDGTVRASARSIPGFDIGAALSRCRDMFIRHGGHPQAAGFVMSPNNMNHLKEALVEVAAEAMGATDPRPAIHIDAEVSIRSLTGDTFHWAQRPGTLRRRQPSPGVPDPATFAPWRYVPLGREGSTCV